MKHLNVPIYFIINDKGEKCNQRQKNMVFQIKKYKNLEYIKIY